jgi:serine/threonine-protein kinase HipA
MYKPVNVVEVKLWDETIGAVALDSVSGYYAFEYSRNWGNKYNIAPLTMPASTEVYVFPNLPETTYKRLPAMLADALPDDFGNALIDAYLAKQGVPKESITSLDRLAYMANRSMGALEFKPSRSPKNTKASAIAISQLVEGSRKALAGSFDGDREAEAAILNIIQVGTSAGGARAKAVIAWNPKTEEIRSGQLAVESGFEHWLLKLDGVGKDSELGTGSDYGRIEYAYYLMARKSGITISDSRLLEENGRAHFMTKRFDRDGNQKHHIQTLCAMNHLDYRQRGTHDYSQYFLTILSLGLHVSYLIEAFRRMVFNVLMANCDDHTKNFSFILKQAKDWEWGLAPAYDVTHAYNPNGEWTYQHLMSVNGKFKDITKKDLMALADRFQVRDAKAIIEEVLEARGEWMKFSKLAGLNKDISERVMQDFVKM